MRAPAHVKTRALLVLALGAATLLTTGSIASAATQNIELCAVTGALAPLPTSRPGFTVPVWGFGTPSTPGDCSTATASVPGPVITVNEGDVVNLTVRNALPAGHTLSLELPSVDVTPGATDAAPGAAVTRTFTAGKPGTYLYVSGGDAGRQQAMGLYGALVVRATTPTQAYDDPATAFDVERTLVLGAIDPAFNAAPDTFDMRNFAATYWVINGRSFPDTAAVAATAGQRLLLRYVNAGYDNTTMQLLGMHERVVGRDAVALRNPYLAVSETIAAGSTTDAIATIPAGAAPSTNGFALYNRQLHLTNGAPADPQHDPGGMLTFITP